MPEKTYCPNCPRCHHSMTWLSAKTAWRCPYCLTGEPSQRTDSEIKIKVVPVEPEAPSHTRSKRPIGM